MGEVAGEEVAGGEAAPPAATRRTLIAFHHFLQAHIEGAGF